MANQTTAEHLVGAGAALLDLYGPFLWRSKIDRGTLAIPSNYDCILGQLYGSFGSGIVEIERLCGAPPHRWAYTTGFMPSVAANAAQLRFAWIRLLPLPAPISVRRAA